MNQLKTLLHTLSSDHVRIQMHQFPDPDAIACAFAAQELLRLHGISSDIYYSGLIDMTPTIMMVEYIGVALHRAGTDTVCDEPVLYVDSQPANGNTSATTGSVTLAIDHHAGFHNEHIDFLDIRPAYGACSSILAEYFQENDLPMSKKVATALVYGQQVDTDNFTRGCIDEDVFAFAYLFPKCDKAFINTLHRSRIDREGLRAYVHSLNNIQIEDGIGLVDVGDHCPDGMVASICDFVLSIQEVQIAVVFSKRSNGIKFSMRSSSPECDAGILMHAMILHRGNGGGHAQMAGGFAPYPADKTPEELLHELIERLLYVKSMIC